MAKVILNHKVKDFDTWKALYDGDKARRDAIGLTEIAVGRKSDDPSMAYMIWDVKDISAMDNMINNPELQKAMQEGGVISAPEMVIIN